MATGVLICELFGGDGPWQRQAVAFMKLRCGRCRDETDRVFEHAGDIWCYPCLVATGADLSNLEV